MKILNSDNVDQDKKKLAFDLFGKVIGFWSISFILAFFQGGVALGCMMADDFKCSIFNYLTIILIVIIPLIFLKVTVFYYLKVIKNKSVKIKFIVLPIIIVLMSEVFVFWGEIKNVVHQKIENNVVKSYTGDTQICFDGKQVVWSKYELDVMRSGNYYIDIHTFANFTRNNHITKGSAVDWRVHSLPVLIINSQEVYLVKDDSVISDLFYKSHDPVFLQKGLNTIEFGYNYFKINSKIFNNISISSMFKLRSEEKYFNRDLKFVGRNEVEVDEGSIDKCF